MPGLCLDHTSLDPGVQPLGLWMQELRVILAAEWRMDKRSNPKLRPGQRLLQSGKRLVGAVCEQWKR
ncbi:Tumor Necrosis Factor Receptor Superfamily Member 14 [Manis pentadactyla]|nr:Tumor Necrosis Factor Receptor Superfamily Member 14 [Manis pentadactyla]